MTTYTGYGENPAPGPFTELVVTALAANYSRRQAYQLAAGFVPECSYANEGGSGDRTALITVSSNMTISSGVLSNLVDGGTGNNSTDSMKFETSRRDATIRFEFPTPVEICEVRIRQQSATTHGFYRFFGVADGAYSLLSGIFELNSADQSIVLADVGAFTIFELVQWDGPDTSSTPWIQEVDFKIRPGITELDPFTPSYANKGGCGPRDVSICEATTSYVLVAGDAQNLLDSNIDTLGTTHLMRPDNSQISGYVQFHFYAPVIITEARMWTNLSLDHDFHQWKGSNDGSTWTNIGSAFHFLTAGETGFTVGDISSNSIAYEYYRLELVSGQLDASEELWEEIEFKIAEPAP